MFLYNSICPWSSSQTISIDQSNRVKIPKFYSYWFFLGQRVKMLSCIYSICDVESASLIELMGHVNRFHTCAAKSKECGRSFGQTPALITHKQALHDNNLQCPVCPGHDKILKNSSTMICSPKADWTAEYKYVFEPIFWM
jgi:hypothetical protein